MENLFYQTKEYYENQTGSLPTIEPKGTKDIDNFDDIVLNANPGDTVSLVHNPHNQYNPLAVQLIHDDSGEFIGYLPKRFCQEYHDEKSAGFHWGAIIETLHDPEPGFIAGIVLSMEEIDSEKVVKQASVYTDEDELIEGVYHLVINSVDREDKDTARETASNFVDFCRNIVGHPKTNDRHDPASSERIYNAAKVFLNGFVDLSVFSEKELKMFNHQCKKLITRAHESGYDDETFYGEDHFAPYLPESVSIITYHPIRAGDTLMMELEFDEDIGPTLWSNGDPHTTLVSTCINFVLTNAIKDVEIPEIEIIFV